MPDGVEKEAPRCPLCTATAVQSAQAHRDFPGTQIYECAKCQFWFAHPVPSAADLENYYRTTYSEGRTWNASTEYLVLMQRRARAQRKFIGDELIEVRAALDIGCGVGALVANLGGLGIAAVGYDSDGTVIRIGRERWKANIHEGHISGPDATRSFDLLCLSHVVEHLPQPVADLAALAGRVRPGGLLFVEVPHCISWMFSHGVETDSHLGFYSSQAFVELARKAGLEVVRLRTCGPPIEDYYRSRRARAAGPAALRGVSRWVSAFRRRAAKLASRLGVVRTEYDGWFESYHCAGDEPRLWLRALLRRPGSSDETAAEKGPA